MQFLEELSNEAPGRSAPVSEGHTSPFAVSRPFWKVCVLLSGRPAPYCAATRGSEDGFVANRQRRNRSSRWPYSDTAQKDVSLSMTRIRSRMPLKKDHDHVLSVSGLCSIQPQNPVANVKSSLFINGVLEVLHHDV